MKQMLWASKDRQCSGCEDKIPEGRIYYDVDGKALCCKCYMASDKIEKNAKACRMKL